MVEQAVPGRKNCLALVASPGGAINRNWFNGSNHVDPRHCQLCPSLCLGLEFPDLGTEVSDPSFVVVSRQPTNIINLLFQFSFQDLEIKVLDLMIKALDRSFLVLSLGFPVLGILVGRLVNSHLGDCECLAKGSRSDWFVG